MTDVPKPLFDTVGLTEPGKRWLAELPRRVAALANIWQLRLGAPFEEEASAAWVARRTRRSGERLVLKVGFPHMEAEQEIDGLLYWDADPTVTVIEYDHDANAMLLEDCQQGTTLRQLPETEQDVVIARLLRRLWRVPTPPHNFRTLRTMIEYWIDEAQAQRAQWLDVGLAEQGIETYRELLRTNVPEVLLATDLHAGNVLRAEREPWLVIDPKPFVGDACYDATQHLLNCRERLAKQPMQLISTIADLLQVDGERVRAWTFARLATQSGEREADRAIARVLVA
jgi:streptomycin 6-kinase